MGFNFSYWPPWHPPIPTLTHISSESLPVTHARSFPDFKVLMVNLLFAEQAGCWSYLREVLEKMAEGGSSGKVLKQTE